MPKMFAINPGACASNNSRNLYICSCVTATCASVSQFIVWFSAENACVRCLRSSPIASLLGFIVVLIGGGAFGGATIFARRYLIALLDAPNL